MDEGGKMVIDFKYDLAQKFNEGYASVALGNMPCLIDINEKRIVDTGIYQFIGMYSEGLVSVMDYKFKRFYLSNKGAVALSLPIEIYDARPFYKGLARVGKKIDIVQNKFGFDISNLGYKFGYMRKDGSMATGFDFDDCDDFEEEVSRFMQGTKFGLIDSSSKVRLEPSYQMISAFNEDIAVVNAMGKFGYINKDGKELIAATYDYAMPFNEGLAAVEIQGNIAFEEVNFSYNEGQPVLKGISFTLEKGKTLALVGATGAGKSSIINLLSRFYDISSGRITIDGISVQTYTLESLRSKIAVVLQDVFLFSGTIMDNIKLYNVDISDEKVIETAKLLGAHEFISLLPFGYQQPVMERGATLSVGQRQLISFVRAMVHNPAILVLDEATSSIDHETEEIIQNAIEKMRQGRSSIMIAHRLSTISHADEIIVLEKGEIVERGTHTQLLQNSKFYKELYEHQFASTIS
jgi:ABC-type multidrug transport system fused ATPase/permease subunit